MTRDTSRERGFTLVELIVAAGILLVVTLALVQLAMLTERLARAQADMSELNQRGRVAGAQLYRDLVMAGAGPWHGDGRGAVTGVLPGVRPARAGAKNPDPELTFADDRISILYVPDTRSEAPLLASMPGPAFPIVIDAAAPGCPGDGICGFREGDRALIVAADGSFGVFTIQHAAGGVITPSAPLSIAFPEMSTVAQVAERVYYIDKGLRRLMLYDGAVTDAVVADNVSDLRFTYYADIPGTSSWEQLDAPVLTDGPVLGQAPHRFDADLLRVRRIRVSLTVQVSDGWLAWGGWARERVVSLDVTPRNLGLWR